MKQQKCHPHSALVLFNYMEHTLFHLLVTILHAASENRLFIKSRFQPYHTLPPKIIRNQIVIEAFALCLSLLLFLCCCERIRDAHIVLCYVHHYATRIMCLSLYSVGFYFFLSKSKLVYSCM